MKYALAVCDNGKGMTPEKIEELLHVDPEEQEQALRIRKSHVSGIGVDNVLQRLRLFLWKDGCHGDYL